MVRMFSLALAMIALALFVGVPVGAQDKQDKQPQPGKQAKNIHTGKFLSAEGAGKSFKMEDKGGKEHSHTLAADAKVIGADGKDARLADLKRGQMIRVTTRENDPTTATRVEVVRELNPGANKLPQQR